MEEKLKAFYQMYYDNEKCIRKMDNELFEPTNSAEEWTTRLKRRSVEIRRAYNENVAGIDENLTAIIQDYHTLTEETAEFLLHEISKQNMYTKRDFMLNRPVLESLVKFYEERGNKRKARQAYIFLGNCYVLSLLEEEYRDEFDYQRKATLDLNDYALLSISMKESAINENYNYFVIMCVLTSVPYEAILEIGEQLIEFLHREDVKGDAKEFQKLKLEEFEYLIKMNMVEAYYGKEVPKLSTVFKIRGYAEQILEENPKDTSLYAYARYWDFLSEEISGNEYFEDLYKIYFSDGETCSYYESISSIKDAGKMPASFYIAADVAHAVRYTDYSMEKQARLYDQIIQRFIADSQMAKKGCFDVLLSDYIQRFIYSLDAYCGPKETLLNAIVDISIRQQVQTYLHSVMVKNIAMLILDDILAHEPKLLIGYKGYEREEDIIFREDEIREYVRFSALLHDVGKMRISEVVNLQCRKLTDQEFLEIQKHTVYGYRMISRFLSLKEYGDVIIGHHKYYDGKGGYPKEFDNCASPYKVVIDLITIVDTIDSATDIMGRNYAAGKDFYKVMSELVKGAGTRYSKELVSYIDSREEVKQELSDLVSTKRTSIYRDVYGNIVNAS